MVGLPEMWTPFVNIQTLIRMHVQQVYRLAVELSGANNRAEIQSSASALIQRCPLLDAAMVLERNATRRVWGGYARWALVRASSVYILFMLCRAWQSLLPQADRSIVSAGR